MQRLNHHHLFIFWIFGKTESFTKTANELSIAQSAVTAQIRSLESNLGIHLINRINPRRPQITAEGRKVLDYANSIFETSRELLNWSTKGGVSQQKILRIGAVSGLSRNFQYEFIQPYVGKKNYKFEISTADQKTLVDQMNHHLLDVILTSHSVLGESDGKIHVNVLTTTPIIFVTKSAKQGRVKKTHLQEHLRNCELYLPGKNFEAKPELDAFLEKLNVKYRLFGEIDDIALLRLFALKSGAVVAVPEMGVKNDLHSGDLEILGTAKGVQQRFYAITRERLSPDKDIQFLIRAMQK
jgi:LysR family transcriptional activator of nhaA